MNWKILTCPSLIPSATKHFFTGEYKNKQYLEDFWSPRWLWKVLTASETQISLKSQLVVKKALLIRVRASVSSAGVVADTRQTDLRRLWEWANGTSSTPRLEHKLSLPRETDPAPNFLVFKLLYYLQHLTTKAEKKKISKIMSKLQSRDI